MTNTDTDLYTRVGRMEGKIDLMLSTQSVTNSKIDHLDQRMDKVEKASAFGRGRAAGIAAVAAIFGVGLEKMRAMIPWM